MYIKHTESVWRGKVHRLKAMEVGFFLFWTMDSTFIHHQHGGKYKDYDYVKSCAHTMQLNKEKEDVA